MTLLKAYENVLTNGWNPMKHTEFSGMETPDGSVRSNANDDGEGQQVVMIHSATSDVSALIFYDIKHDVGYSSTCGGAASGQRWQSIYPFSGSEVAHVLLRSYGMVSRGEFAIGTPEQHEAFNNMLNDIGSQIEQNAL